MSLPLIRELVRRHSSVTILTPSMYADLFRFLPEVEVAGFDNHLRHGLPGAFALASEIRALELSHLNILPQSISSALSAWLAGVPHRIGHASDGRGILLSEMHAVPFIRDGRHRAQSYLDLLGDGNITVPYSELVKNAALSVTGEQRRAIRSRLNDAGIGEHDTFAVLPFRAVAESRRWGKENYAALGVELARQFNLVVVLVGSAADSDEGEWLRSEIGTSAVNLAGQTTIGELAALMAESAIVIGNDSGPCHLAAAVGAPLVVISGADDPRETSPLSHRKIVIRADHLDCLACVKNRCPLTGIRQMRCMRDIEIETVVAGAGRLLARGNNIDH